MMRLVWIARFLLILPLVPPAILAGLALATATGIVAIVLDLSPGAHTLAPLLLLQLFACSSGFRVPACRGHYDLLLTSGDHRLVVGTVHWLMSALPGALGWMAILAVDRLWGSAVLATPDVQLAMLLASTIPWALTIALPRTSGALICLLALATVMALAPALAIRAPALPPVTQGAAAGVAAAALAGALAWIRVMDVPLEQGQ